MESVIIVAPQGYDMTLQRRLEVNTKFRHGTPGTWVVEEGQSRVYVSRDDTVAEEFEPETYKRITSVIQDPIFYTVDFSDITLCRRVLNELVDDPKLLIDNDHGVLLPGSEFVKVMRSHGDWDWRYESYESICPKRMNKKD